MSLTPISVTLLQLGLARWLLRLRVLLSLDHARTGDGFEQSENN